MSLHQRLVRDLAVELPGATAIFRRRKIDFCCNGGVTLEEAATRRGVSLDELTRELDRLTPVAAEAPAPTDELLAHIVERYHDVHREEFPEAIRMAARVEAVHAQHLLCPHGLAGALATIAEELFEHQDKEEAILFPLMLSGHAGPMIGHPIARMMQEHEVIGEQLDELARLTQDYVPPEGACTTWRALYAACRKLDEDLREHVHLENNVLFPRFSPAAG
jgi:regulator of cell morphogenesis and NO signaling